MVDFPSPRIRRFLWLYAAGLAIGLPFILLYLLWRSRREPAYRSHIAERFGRYRTTLTNAVWVHAVSLGEVRSAIPLIRALLDRGEYIVITCFTPAGRGAAEAELADAITAGRVVVAYVPLEFDWVYRRFFNAFTPKYGLVMEVEFWPRMIASAHRHDVPLFLCNGQYPGKSFERDRSSGSIRTEIVRGFSGLFVKSQMMVDRFAQLGTTPPDICGELRFEQPVNPALTHAAARLKPQLSRPVITVSSLIEGEEDQILPALAKLSPDTQLIIVPRAPARFEPVAEKLSALGLRVGRRSTLFDTDFTPLSDPNNVDVILGDSLGEMYFYLSLSDEVVTGGGLVPAGSHNIIETLAMRKPVLVGPNILTIEYPGYEAIAAGVARQFQAPDDMLTLLRDDAGRPHPQQIDLFLENHGGAVAKTLSAIDRHMGRNSA